MFGCGLLLGRSGPMRLLGGLRGIGETPLERLIVEACPLLVAARGRNLFTLRERIMVEVLESYCVLEREADPLQAVYPHCLFESPAVAIAPCYHRILGHSEQSGGISGGQWRQTL